MLNFTNPLYKHIKRGEPKGQPDPYMIEYQGTYYTYATNTEGVTLYASDDFDDWRYLGICLKEDGWKEYWAPSVIERDGTFYMYYSSMPMDSSDTHDQQLKVAVSDRPEGPFRKMVDLLPPFSIDAHVVDNGRGEWYIFYCNNNYEAERAGTYILVDKLNDPFTVDGHPVPVVLPTLDEEIYERDRFRKGQHWHTIEGAFYFEDNGWHYLMYSGSTYKKDTYFIGYSVAQGDEHDLRKLMFQKVPNDTTYEPLMKKDEFVEGVGHNSVMKVDGNYYVIYHGRDVVKSDVEHQSEDDTRTFRADLLIANQGRLTVVKRKPVKV